MSNNMQGWIGVGLLVLLTILWYYYAIIKPVNKEHEK